jgi:hypothetical protein
MAPAITSWTPAALASFREQLKHPNDDRRILIYTAGPILRLLAAISVVARFFARIRAGQKLLTDDWCSVVGLAGGLWRTGGIVSDSSVAPDLDGHDVRPQREQYICT